MTTVRALAKPFSSKMELGKDGPLGVVFYEDSRACQLNAG